MQPELSVVILCYKEGEKVYGFVDKVIGLLEKEVPSWELVLVANFWEDSGDETPAVVSKIAETRTNIKAVTMPKQGRMGWDARSGLEKAEGRYICFIDGDAQMPAEDIIRVYRKIKEEGLDFVKTYRVKRHDSAARVLNSNIYNVIFNLLFPGVHARDANSKPKILTKEAYERLDLRSDDWFLDAEMLIQARRLRLRIGELPTEFYKCDFRKSYVRLDAMLEFAVNLLRARIKEFFR